MRVKRFKKFQRNMSFFEKNFGFQEPYQILIDGTFANAVLAGKVNMKEQFPKYFDGPCKLVTSPCVMVETEKLGPALYGAVQVLKGLQLHKCQHLEKPIPASECLKSIAGKSFRGKPKKPIDIVTNDEFIVATQDANLRHHFRQLVGVPLLYLHGNAPTLEKPSDASTKWAEKRDKKKLEMSGYQKEILQHIKDDILPSNDGSDRKGTKKRKRAGPNPLSCKKPKKQKIEATQPQVPSTSQSQDDHQQKKKRKRIKVRVPKHIKELSNSN